MTMETWQRYGFDTEEEWMALSDDDRTKITGQEWHTWPCYVCNKPVLVAGSTDKPVYCMEHDREVTV